MGQHIAAQVRRALIAAAKVAPVAVVIDAAGCTLSRTCAGTCDPRSLKCRPIRSGGFGGYGTGGYFDAGPVIVGGRGGTDAGRDATDATRDGG